jgi:hypothetical protein
MQEGWLCPKCGRVNAPFMDHCDCVPKIDYIPNVVPFIAPYPLYPGCIPWPYRPWDGTIVVTCEGNTSTYKVESKSSN